MRSVSDELRRIAFLPANPRSSEEDIKINITLPFLRAFGYDDGDFNYEGRTGKGYVDVATDRFPAGIVVETKAPQKKPQDYITQLEEYVFQKHSRDRATVAILTNGEDFLIYGLTDALWRGSLAEN
ncbi:MAG: hypothetical protein M1482_07660 [Chloroflexi bacterium]|nr:hypothetical protein [Chloroflexota bacterium]